MSSVQLTLAEETLLLALEDTEGGLERGSYSYRHALGAAVLGELILREAITLEDRGKRPPLVVAESTSSATRTLPAHPQLDHWLEAIRTAKRRAAAPTWVSRIAARSTLRQDTAARLIELGVLREHEDKVLWIFPRRRYPERDAGPERELVARLDQAVRGVHSVDGRTAVLISLLKATRLLRVAIGKEIVKERKDRIEDISSGNAIGEAAKKAVEAAQAAAAIAATVPIMAVTTTS